MIEKRFDYTVTDEKIVEKLIDDDKLMINHAVLKKGDRLPKHNSDSNVFLIIVRGKMTAELNDQEPHEYTVGDIINVPYDTTMVIGNEEDEVLEFFILKAPSPRLYNK